MTTLSDLVTRFGSKNNIDAALALDCRKAIYGTGLAVRRDQAQALVALNARALTRSRDWIDLYQETLTDYLVNQASPAGYVADEPAAWLMQALAATGPALDESDIDMLLHVLDKADQVPPALSAYVLDQVAQHCVAGFKSKARISDADVERIRRALYATGSADNIAVTRVEAERLFALNAEFHGAAVNPAFDALFAQAIGNAVLYEPLWRADTAREIRDETWLADHRVHPLQRVARTLFHDRNVLGEMEEGLHEVTRGDLASPDGAAQFAADLATEARAEQLTEDEAHWLSGLLSRDGRADPREQALFRFLGTNAHVDAPMPADDSRPQPPNTVPARPAFGHRTTPPTA